MAALFKQASGILDYTPSSAVTAGKLVKLDDGRAGVVVADLAASEKGAVYTEGVFDVDCATGTTFTAGDDVFQDDSADLAVTVPGAPADFYAGKCLVTKTTELVVRIELNAVQALPAAFAPASVVIEHDDTAEHHIVTANQNPNGLLVQTLSGILTEVCAGSSQDQLIVALYDEDDNELSSLTVSDAAADAVGDLIVGALSAGAAATGTVAAVIPAGKGAYIKVKQATAGGTPAGAMRVSALLSPY